MRKIRVLVVDDAVVVRRLVTDVLAADPDIEVVGTAANGRLALAKLAQLKPDLITLDIEMPEMDGLETLVELRKSHPRLPVIMFSTLTERGAAATLEALARGRHRLRHQARQRRQRHPRPGADPGGADPEDPGARRKGHAVGPACRARGSDRPRLLRRARRPSLPVRIDILAIGVSTGGPNALAEVLPALPADFPIPIVIVQHMPPMFTKFLADRLSSVSKLSVREGEEGGLVEPGVVWIAPGNHHMVAPP